MDRLAPSKDVLENWIEKYYESDEVWFFESYESYEKFLNGVSLTEDLRSALLNLYREVLVGDTAIRIVDFYENGQERGVVIVPEILRARIPNELIERLYQFKTGKHLNQPPHLISAPNQAEMFRSLRTVAQSDEAFEKLKSQIVETKEGLMLPVVPLNWKLFTIAARTNLLKEIIKRNLRNYGLSPTITIGPENKASEVATQIAAGRNVTQVERMLLQRINGHQNEITLPLHEVMPDFIKRHWGTYSTCHGPNCYHASMNASREADHDYHSTSPQELREYLSKGFRSVQSGESIRSGDVLVYANEHNEIKHSAFAVTPHILFTKNGFVKFAPYKFQFKFEVEHLYFGPGKPFKLMVFRRNTEADLPPSWIIPSSPVVFFDGTKQQPVDTEIYQNNCVSTLRAVTAVR